MRASMYLCLASLTFWSRLLCFASISVPAWMDVLFSLFGELFSNQALYGNENSKKTQIKPLSAFVEEGRYGFKRTLRTLFLC